MSDPSAATASEHLVLCMGCDPLHQAFRDLGLLVHPVTRLSELRNPSPDLTPRAIVLGPRAARDLDLEHQIPRIRQAWPLVDVLVWYPGASPSLVRRALKAGAADVLLSKHPATVAQAADAIIDSQQLLPRQETLSTTEAGFGGMLARSRQMFDLFETAAQVAQSDAAVLILGETGTGKELLARAIHERSRRPGRFVALNCGAVPETLIDSELFGHIEGAFTGATRAKAGLFRHADGGTLLLDEAGNVPLPVQYRLLRVLQEGAVRPVGAHNEEPVDVRVLAATSASLEDDVQAGHFREDLFYRLDVIRLVIPPLRERPEDIVFLFVEFARRFAENYRVERPDVTDAFLDALVAHPWPGNVRQLENFTERLVLTQVGQRVGVDRFNEMVAFRAGSPPSPRRVQRVSDAGFTVDDTLPMSEALQPHIETLERRYIEALLERHDGRVIRSAEAAGVSRRTMTRLLGRLDVDPAQFK